MNLQNQDKERVYVPDSAKFTNSGEKSSKLSVFFEQLHTVNTLHLISALLQIVLGLTAVLLSVLELIQGRLASTVMSMLGSLSAMIGLFFLYTLTFRASGEEKLLRDAMRRIMNAHN